MRGAKRNDGTPVYGAATCISLLVFYVLAMQCLPTQVVTRVKALAERFKRPRIACLGLSYKPNIDDMRESPALEVVRQLQQLDADIQVFIMQHNYNPRPYKWTKSTDEILAFVKRFFHKANQTSCGEP